MVGLFSYVIGFCPPIATPSFFKWKSLTNRCTEQMWLGICESTWLLSPQRHPQETLGKGGDSTLPLLPFGLCLNISGNLGLLEPPHHLNHILNHPRSKAQCFGTFPGIRNGYSGSDTAAELNSFGKAALGRLRVLGFPGLCANETVPPGRKPEGDGKQGMWG